MSFPQRVQGYVWAETNSGTAHNLTFRMEPDACTCHNQYLDFPAPIVIVPETAVGRRLTAVCDFHSDQVIGAPPKSVRMIVAYRDDWGISWESSRLLNVMTTLQQGREIAERVDGGEFRRRIIEFPPKAYV